MVVVWSVKQTHDYGLMWLSLGWGDSMNERELRLARMKRAMTGVLLLALGVFVASLWLERHVSPAWSYLRAFSEAAMVGGIADWFAVVALFRHPLGIPFPHTAIIPTGKKRIGEALGQFIVQNFLARDVLAPRIAQIDMVGRLAEWLLNRKSELADRLVKVLPMVIERLDDGVMKRFIASEFKDAVRSLDVAPMTGRALELLTAGDRHVELVRKGMVGLGPVLERNRAAIEEEIARELPLGEVPILSGMTKPVRVTCAAWIGQRMMRKWQTLVREMGENPQHPIYGKFRQLLDDQIAKLKESPEWWAKGNEWRDSILESEAVGHYLNVVWLDIKQKIIADLKHPESRLKAGAESILGKVAEDLQRDEPLRAKLNAWLQEAIVESAVAHREKVAGFVQATVDQWEAKDMVSRLELEVGRDLQFIRLNGTIIGGAVGLAIHSVLQAVH